MYMSLLAIARSFFKIFYMSHVLATFHGIEKDLIEDMIHDHIHKHKDDIYVEHLWQNADDMDEIVFLFKVDDIDHMKQILEKVHLESIKHNPKIIPPKIIYLKK